MSYICFENVCKFYKNGENITRAADGITFSAEKGEFIVIVGPSGAGKTTVLNMLGGMDKCDSGKIILDFDEVSAFNRHRLTEYRRYDVGFVFQFYNLVQNLTAKENVALPLVISGVPSWERNRRVRAALDQVALLHRADHLPGALSGGQMQRVALARALVTNPCLILADEPTGNLDPKSADRMMELLLAQRKSGCCVIMITHAPSLAKRADRLMYLKEGRLVADA